MADVECPRPQWVRANGTSINGLGTFAVDDALPNQGHNRENFWVHTIEMEVAATRTLPRVAPSACL